MKSRGWSQEEAGRDGDATHRGAASAQHDDGCEGPFVGAPAKEQAWDMCAARMLEESKCSPAHGPAFDRGMETSEISETSDALKRATSSS